MDEQGFSLRLGAVLAEAITFCGRHVVGLCALTLVLYAPFVLLLLSAQQSSSQVAALAQPLAGFLLLPILLQVLVTAAVGEHVDGRPSTILRSIGSGLHAVLPSLGVLVTWLLISMVAVGVVALPVQFLTAGLESAHATSIVRGGAAAFTVAVVTCPLLLAPNVLVLERVSFVRAMGRSRALTRGSRLRILLILGLCFTLLFGSAWAMGALGGAVFDSWEMRPWWVALNAARIGVIATFGAVCLAVVYARLRRDRDQAHSERQISEVFD